jgi:predicted dehydrogenase
METIGVGLIGTGFMGKCHALAWNAVRPVFGDCPRPRLVHLADAGEVFAAEKASEFGFARSTGTWRDLLSDPEVEVVSVTAPNAFHAEMAIAALEAGKHVWCEKPMATSLGDAARMRDAAKASGRVAVLGYNYIQNPAIRQIQSLLKAGTIGTVNHLRIEMDEDFMADANTPFNWKSEASSGYGALDDFAVHPLSLIRILFGTVQAVMTDMSKPIPNCANRFALRPVKERCHAKEIFLRLLRADQAAAALALSTTTIRRLIAEGILPASQRRAAWIIRLADLERDDVR